MNIEATDIRRHGKQIRLGQGRTATEGMDGNLASLSIREHGKQIKLLRGSSLGFCDELTTEDREFLASLCSF